MFHKELLYLIITITYLQDETSALSSPSDPRLTIINVYSGLETVNGDKVSKHPPENILKPDEDKNKGKHDYHNEDESVNLRKRVHTRRSASAADDRDPIFVVDSNHRLRRLSKLAKTHNSTPTRKQMYPPQTSKNKTRKRSKSLRYSKRRSKVSRVRS